MKTLSISLPEARYLALHNQMLLDTHLHKTKNDLLKIIEQIGYVQIDTISIVERAHKHTLWARFPDYKNEMLDELIDKDKKVFEYWDHAAAYIPMKHFRFSYFRKEKYRQRHNGWAKKNKKLLNFILDRIKNEGALQSRDFEDPAKRGMWWDWKPAKEGLEYLFHSGFLAVKARKSFQKVYDLPERVLPGKIDTSTPNDEEHARHLILKSITANGFACEREMVYLRYHDRKAAKKALNILIEHKKIIPLKVEGAKKETYFTTKKILKQLDEKKDDNRIHILSPFDNLVIQRKRLNTLFDFDYVIECYLPAPKRKYGYFCLPVLLGDKFIARIDAKADRAGGTFRIINIFWEDGMKLNQNLRKKFEDQIMKLAQFSGCKEVIFN